MFMETIVAALVTTRLASWLRIRAAKSRPRPHWEWFLMPLSVAAIPATGRILSDLILTGKSSLVDTRLFSLERFAEGHLLEETAVL